MFCKVQFENTTIRVYWLNVTNSRTGDIITVRKGNAVSVLNYTSGHEDVSAESKYMSTHS
jgi:hypothetical protein